MGTGVAPESMARAVHDLHGPLTVIRGLCATLGRDEPRADRRRGLELIDGEALRLAAGLEGLVASAPSPPRSGGSRSPRSRRRRSSGTAPWPPGAACD